MKRPPNTALYHLSALGALWLAFAHAPAQASVEMYVSSGGGSIYQVTTTGVASAFATLPGSNPTGEQMAVDPSGNLYVTDYQNNQIDKITPGGSVSVLVNFSSIDPGGGLYGLVYSGGNLYATDFNNNKLLKVTLTPTVSASVFASSAGNGPLGLAIDSNGNFYTPDGNINKITEISSTGSVNNSFATTPNLGFAGGLAFDSSGNLFVADFNSSGKGIIDKFSSGGVYQGTFGSYPTSFSPIGLQFATNGDLLVADNGNNDIRDYPSTGGAGTVFAPTSGSLAFANYFVFAPVPEPGSTVLLAIGLSAFLGRRRRARGK